MHGLMHAATLAAALTLYHGAPGATPVLDEPGESAAQAQEPGHPGSFTFDGSPCQLAAGSEAVEFSAFDQWQGALTEATGEHQALVYDALAAQALVADATVDGAGQQVAEEITDPTDQFESAQQQRQRLFALGLAVLLRLNAKR